jgi:ElaB/YqjD/DUF883 family membrane-anchored ribosome-binding protein
MQAYTLMNDWPDVRERVRARWPRLEEDDLAAIDGDPDYLRAALRERYGWDEERARLEVDSFLVLVEQADLRAELRATLGPGGEKLREGLRELGEGLRVLARDAVELGRGRLDDATVGLRERAGEGTGQVTQGAGRLIARAERFVHERPLVALGVAAAAGWLLLGRR